MTGEQAAITVDLGVFFEPGLHAATLTTVRPLQGHGFLLRGARASGKTSLAFQAAINAVRAGGNVLVVCREALLYSKVPQPFVPLNTLPEESLGKIEFIYVESWSAATTELMGLQSAHEVPALVLVDDDGFLLEGEKPAGAASCLSYLESMATWMRRCKRAFYYIVVSNAFAEHADTLSLPYAAFPVVDLHFGRTGEVRVTPTAGDTALGSAFRLRWDNGLQLVA